MAKTIKNLVILVWTFHIKQCMMPWFILLTIVHFNIGYFMEASFSFPDQ